jgi:hypothetical protein
MMTFSPKEIHEKIKKCEHRCICPLGLLAAIRCLHAPRADFNVVRTNSGSRVNPSCPYSQSYHVHFELMR